MMALTADVLNCAVIISSGRLLYWNECRSLAENIPLLTITDETTSGTRVAYFQYTKLFF